MSQPAAQVARNAALMRLTAMHRADYDRLYDEERVKRNLQPLAERRAERAKRADAPRTTTTRWNPPLPDDTAAALRAIAPGPDYRRRGRTLDSGYCRAVAALHEAGWTLQAIGDAVGVTREAIRIAEAKATPGPVPLDRIPLRPARPAPVPKPKRHVVEVSASVAAALRAKQVVARTVNGATPADDPARRASESLTADIAALVDRGVTVIDVARAMGVTHTAVKSRLVRHGYRDGAASYPPYLGAGVREPLSGRSAP